VTDLRGKLARLFQTESPPLVVSDASAERVSSVELVSPTDEARLARIAALRALIAEKERSDRNGLRTKPLARSIPRERGLPGAVEETPLGPLHRVTNYLLPAHRHGRIAIADALRVSAASMAALALDPELASIRPSRMLLLDTETTGLSGGTGTLPFLIGMAWFEDESLKVEQLLLRRPGEEAPMLTRLAERLSWADCVVTYNGKSFDWPLLRTRAVMNRIRVPAPKAHLDLLHAARRVFGPRIGSARLVTMEEQVLGMRRERDIDGAEIPTLYWDFVRGAEGHVLVPVIEHNANDLVALAALVAVLDDRWRAPAKHHEPEDRVAIARVALRGEQHAFAYEVATRVADEEPPPRIAYDALTTGADAARKLRDPHAELSLLSRAVELCGDHPKVREAHLRMAICLEHRHRDPARALVHAEQAGDGEKRMARLSKKIAKRAEKKAKR
jgi:uncharacterized protein YprB with RNaseH-like and TPR domain